MKRFILGLLACLAITQVQAGDSSWLTDLPKAQVQAKKEKKLVLIDFTGSDWCGWCIKLNKEIFSQKEFIDYAKENLVLVEIDFPRKKQLPKEQVAANEALAKKYKVKGFPTIVVLDGDGKKVGELGYMRGGPKAFTDELAKLKPGK